MEEFEERIAKKADESEGDHQGETQCDGNNDGGENCEERDALGRSSEGGIAKP